MVGLGVDEFDQPVPGFPDLPDGAHLRWAFSPTAGFARHGYYLFRRPSGPRKEPVYRTIHYFDQFNSGSYQTPISIDNKHGEIEIDGPPSITLTDAYTLDTATSFSSGPDGRLEIALPAESIQISFPTPVYSVRAVVAVDEPVTLTAYGREESGTETSLIPVDSARIENSGTVEVQFDAITDIDIQGTGTLIDFQFQLVVDTLSAGWRPVPGLNGPIGLPLTHPDYPATGWNQPALNTDRQTALDRIQYGNGSEFVPPQSPPIQTGQATVEDGSAIVTATSEFSEDVVGSVFRAAGDGSAYLIASRPDSHRLMLTRSYRGQSTTTPFVISDDPFGELHDSLATLIADGPDSGGMSARIQPEPLAFEGWSYVPTGSKTVYGWGTGWSDALEGAEFYPGIESSGTVTVTPGETTVSYNGNIPSNSDWDSRLAGCTFQLFGQRTVYTVISATPLSLELDRPYDGPAQSDASYAILSPTGISIESVNGPDELQLAAPFYGEPTSPAYSIRPTFATDDSDGPVLRKQYPLESVLLASLSPAVAQALGLYWIDTFVEPSDSYDYLILADHLGVVDRFFQPDTDRAVDLSIFGPDGDLAEAVDGYVTFGVSAATTEPPNAPAEPAVFELPPRPPGSGTGHRNVTGLSWIHPTSETGRSLPETPVQYHVWRTLYGEERPEDPAPSSTFTPITSLPKGTDDDSQQPILATRQAHAQPDDWPDSTIHLMDSSLDDGWYGYRIAGVDVFGRVSPQSGDATWRDSTDNTQIHSFGIEVVDDVPPPPPRAVTADHHPTQTEAGVGNGMMTVQWYWPSSAQAQAPDTTAFQIHYQPGNFADLEGSILASTESDGTFVVQTDILPIEPEGSIPPGEGYAGSTFHVGDTSFLVVDSGVQNSLLEFTVVDTRAPALESLKTQDGERQITTVSGQTERIRPTDGVPCTLSIPPTYSRGTVTVEDGSTTVIGTETDWHTALEGQSFTTPDGGSYTIVSVDDSVHLTLDSPYHIPSPDSDVRAGIQYAIDHPVRPTTADAAVWSRPPNPADWEADWATIALSEGEEIYPSAGDHPYPGQTEPYLLFETTIPVPAEADPSTDPFIPTDTQPVVYANVGVTAIDETGAESRVGGPAPLVRRKTQPPPVPEVPEFEAAIQWATPPDYAGESQFTLRWKDPEEACATHIYRVMDKSLFRFDWERRRAGDSQDLTVDDAEVFPPGPRENEGARAELVETLDDLHCDVSNESEFSDALEHYLSLEVLEKQLLAALPANFEAFQQLTVDPLDSSMEAAENRLGPDEDPDDAIPTDPGWCAYVDRFPGMAPRQYFYRTRTVDQAGNWGDSPTYPTPPVQAENTVPPNPPTPESVLGGIREISLTWRSNPESDVEAYHIYRTTDTAISDIRRMSQVHTEPASAEQTVTWVDTDPPILTEVSYRLTAVDGAGNESSPSAALVGRAVDPDPPDPETPSIETESGPEPTVTWDSTYETILQRRSTGAARWESLTDWTAPGDQTYADTGIDLASTYEYRLRARKPQTGAVAAGDAVSFEPTTND